MAETLQDRLRKEADRGTEKSDGRDCCYSPWTCCDPALLRAAAAKLDELESRLSRHDTGREEMRKALFEADDALRIAGGGSEPNPVPLYALIQKNIRAATLSTGGNVAWQTLHEAWGYAHDHSEECSEGYRKDAFGHVQFWIDRLTAIRSQKDGE